MTSFTPPRLPILARSGVDVRVIVNNECHQRMKLTAKIVLATAAITCAFNAPFTTAAQADPVIVRTISGPASWYGPGFQGRKTANGERFDMNELTAAHRSLPFGTKVRVTCRNTGKSVTVRINDRGPFHGNRVIDLSRAAASQIGITNAGVGAVKIDVLA